MSLQLENIEADMRGERRQHMLDNEMRLNLFFEMTGDFRRMGKRPSVKLVRDMSGGSEVGAGRRGDPVVEVGGGRRGDRVEEVGGGTRGDPVSEVGGGRRGDAVVEVGGGDVIEGGKIEDVEEETDPAYTTAEEGEEGNGEDTDERLLLQVDDNLVPLESDFSQDTDTAFDILITRIDKMLDPLNIKVENEVNAFKGCAFYDFS